MSATKNIVFRALVPGAAALFYLSSAWAGIPIQHWQQASGAAVYLVESQAIPMVDVQIDFDAGSRRDPAAQAGLAAVMAAMTSKGVRASGDVSAAGPSQGAKRGDATRVRLFGPSEPAQADSEPRASAPSGGSAVREATSVGAYDSALDENALNEAWADLGASFGASAGNDRLSFSLRSLTYPDLLAKATALAARQLAEPSFPPEVWQRERERLKAALREANTRPATLAGRAFAQAVYGTHPYGYEMTEATLAQIEVADMRALHARMVLPCHAKVNIVGAVTRAQADALASQLLARLPVAAAGSACPALPPVPEVAPLSAAVETRIPFKSAQAHVLVGQPGYKRSDPDFFPLLVGNYILGGGGFVSRLTSEVREKRALSYSVYSYFAPGLHAGAFTLGLETRPDQADQAVQVAREVVARFVADGPTAAELQAAKDNLIGGFALRLDSNRKLLDNVANISWNNLPLDYLDHWTQQVARVTQADIKGAFARKLQPDKMVTVIVGASP